jgi:hypothetical protein
VRGKSSRSGNPPSFLGWSNQRWIRYWPIRYSAVDDQNKIVVMSRIAPICICLFILGCAASKSVDYRNFAIDTYSPSPNEIHLAEARARDYWDRNGSRFGPEPRYLAVETSKLFPYGGLYPKLINSETTASFFSQSGKTNYGNLELVGVMIYDTKTGHFVGNQGYVSVDTPNPGGVARFGDYLARYIGTGRSPFF